MQHNAFDLCFFVDRYGCPNVRVTFPNGRNTEVLKLEPQEFENIFYTVSRKLGSENTKLRDAVDIRDLEEINSPVRISGMKLLEEHDSFVVVQAETTGLTYSVPRDYWSFEHSAIYGTLIKWSRVYDLYVACFPTVPGSILSYRHIDVPRRFLTFLERGEGPWDKT